MPHMVNYVNRFVMDRIKALERGRIELLLVKKAFYC